jgi:hypothetical protein
LGFGIWDFGLWFSDVVYGFGFRLCRSMCGKAMLFRPFNNSFCGYAARTGGVAAKGIGA